MKTSTIGIIATLLTVGGILLQPETSLTNSSAPPANVCYMPGGGGCGSQNCHNNNPNSGPGKIEAAFSGSNNEYVPGQTYSVTITLTDNTKQRFGFQAGAADPSNNQAGTFTITNPDNTSTQSGGGKSFIGHKAAGGNNSWVFQWTAPATDVGPIKLYYAGNAANGNSNTGGDNIYADILALNPAQSVGIASVSNNNDIKILSQDFGTLTIDAGSAAESRQIALLSINGQLLYQNQIAAGDYVVRIPCQDLSTGIYIIQCGQQSIKFIKP